MSHSSRSRSIGLSIALVLGLVAASLSVAPVRAASPGFSVITAGGPSAVPNSNILGASGKEIFQPNKLNAKVTSGGRCTIKNAGAIISNKTNREEIVTTKGSLNGLGPHQQLVLCFPAAKVYIFGLVSNSHAKLTITVA